MVIERIPGLFIPLHFRSRERKDHRENFHSSGTFVPWNIRSLELSLLWNFRSSGVKVPRTFVPWNIHSRGTFVPRERTFQELSFLPMKLSYHENEYFKNFRSKCHKTRPCGSPLCGPQRVLASLNFPVSYRRGYGRYSSICEYRRHCSAVVWVCLRAWVM